MSSIADDFFNEGVDMIGLGAKHLHNEGKNIEEIKQELRSVVSGIQYFIATLEQHV